MKGSVSCLQISTWGTHHVLVSPCKLEVNEIRKRKTITGSQLLYDVLCDGDTAKVSMLMSIL